MCKGFRRGAAFSTALTTRRSQIDTALHFSSATDLWATPQDFYDKCNARFGPFELDVCATPDNAKCSRYFTAEDDGLAQEWIGTCWMNPPYGDPEQPCRSDHAKCKKKRCEKRGYHIDEYVPGIVDWMRKAYESSLEGATVVCLVPSRTCTHWWHDYAVKGDVEFIRGRLKFGDAKDSAPFPSALVVFRPPNP